MEDWGEFRPREREQRDAQKDRWRPKTVYKEQREPECCFIHYHFERTVGGVAILLSING